MPRPFGGAAGPAAAELGGAGGAGRYGRPPFPIMAEVLLGLRCSHCICGGPAAMLPFYLRRSGCDAPIRSAQVLLRLRCAHSVLRGHDSGCRDPAKGNQLGPYRRQTGIPPTGRPPLSGLRRRKCNMTRSCRGRCPEQLLTRAPPDRLRAPRRLRQPRQPRGRCPSVPAGTCHR